GRGKGRIFRDPFCTVGCGMAASSIGAVVGRTARIRFNLAARSPPRSGLLAARLFRKNGNTGEISRGAGAAAPVGRREIRKPRATAGAHTPATRMHGQE